MTTTTAATHAIDDPTDVTEFPKGRIDTVRIGEVVFSRTTFQPGWKWSTSLKDIAGTDSCEYPHTAFVQSGTLHVVMDDGTELDARSGDVLVLAPGHDAWVVGDEAVVMYDFGGDDEEYGKSPS
ncbi:MAG TPA: cupin domain-containing protein [Acidimicrobiales bacterium]|nr:cupin domain-containing protein [Acidimicrobiales bacterium]